MKGYVISGTLIGAIIIGVLPALIIRNTTINVILSMALKGLIIGAASGFLMSMANGLLMSMTNRSQSNSPRRLSPCISVNLLVDSVIGIMPIYLSANMQISQTNDGIVNPIALMFVMSFISLPLTAITIFLIAVVVPIKMFRP